MSHLEYFTYDGFGEQLQKDWYYSQTVRLGDTIELSGQGVLLYRSTIGKRLIIHTQGGWDRKTGVISTEIAKEIDQAFNNVQHALQLAGGKGWEQVYKVRVYVNPLDNKDGVHIVRNLRKYCPNHKPLLTYIGVQALGIETMHIEIEVEAHLGQSK